MLFRIACRSYGAIATLAGLYLMGWGVSFLTNLGTFVVPDNGTFSLSRFAGVGFLLAGALFLAIAPLRDKAMQLRVSVAVSLAHVLGGALLWIQQVAIWNTPLGGVLSALPWIVAVLFGAAAVTSFEAQRGTGEYTRFGR